MYGFIVDGFPKNYSQAKELFEEGERNIANPNSVIIFENIEDDFAINRIKTSEDFPKDPKDPKISIILDRANRRLAKLKEEKNEENYKSLHDFFEEEAEGLLLLSWFCDDFFDEEAEGLLLFS